MYTYNKNDKTYTFSSDELDIDSIIDSVNNPENQEEDLNNEKLNEHEKPKKIEVINGGNDLDSLFIFFLDTIFVRFFVNNF